MRKWFRSRTSATEPVLATPEPATDFDSIFQAELAELESYFDAMTWAQGIMPTLQAQLDLHLTNVHNDDSHTCDLWCLPEPVTNFFGSLDQGNLYALIIVLLKDWHSCQTVIKQWSSGEGDFA